jgi:muconolactone delta-isomerase
MPVYLVECELPGITMEQLLATQRAALETSEQFTTQGKPVRYIRSTFVPGEWRCQCLFEAPNAGLVEEVSDAAGFAYTRILAALELTAEDSHE